MNIGRVKTRSAYFALVLIALLAASPWAARSEAADAARGEYIVRAAGCISCHTQKDGKGEFLAGGRALVSPYGNFYSSNITPDAETGSAPGAIPISSMPCGTVNRRLIDFAPAEPLNVGSLLSELDVSPM